MKRFLALWALALTLAAGPWLLTPAPALADTSSDQQQAEAATDDTQATEDSADAQAPEIVEMTMGPEDAKVTLVEYASFTCPHCATFHKSTFKQLKSDYIDTGKIRFVYRDVYFDRFGLWASMVARCGGPERFFGITGMLYDQQRDWLADGDPVTVSQNLRRIGKVAGLDEAQLDACLADEAKAKALVDWFQKNAEEDEVDSTPTLRIDGEAYSNMSFAELSEILDGKLAE